MSWRKDPKLQEAMQTRPPEYVLLLACPACNKHGYYNAGRHFHCRHCDKCFDVLSDEELNGRLEDWGAGNRAYIHLDDAVSAADLLDEAAAKIAGEVERLRT